MKHTLLLFISLIGYHTVVKPFTIRYCGDFSDPVCQSSPFSSACNPSAGENLTLWINEGVPIKELSYNQTINIDTSLLSLNKSLPQTYPYSIAFGYMQPMTIGGYIPGSTYVWLGVKGQNIQNYRMHVSDYNVSDHDCRSSVFQGAYFNTALQVNQ